MSLLTTKVRPRATIALSASAAVGGLFGAIGGCTTPPTTTSLRALEQSGRMSLVCLDKPGSLPSELLPLSECRGIRTNGVDDFDEDCRPGYHPEGGSGGVAGAGGGHTVCVEDGGAGAIGAGGGAPDDLDDRVTTPHVYGLVLQPVRGEVAVVDLTTYQADAVLDQDPGSPGANFIPVGGSPVGIVSTPGSTATFVTSAEPGREGIYVLPSLRIRPSEDRPAPRLSSWPSCALPGAPGEAILVSDPRIDGLERASCDGVYAEPVPGGENGDLGAEGRGRQKLVVPLPDLGGFAVMDAQALLDLPDGSFDACPIERWVLLDGVAPTIAPPPAPTGPACVSKVEEPRAEVTGTPRPSGIAFADRTLYLGDLSVPLIHRFAMESACDPVPLLPLLPYSLEDPSRVVTTTRIAVPEQPTADLQRFLYAIDVNDNSAMVFDVSANATTRTPLLRDHPEWTPFQSRDRIRFPAAPRDILIVSRDVPAITASGIAAEGIRCSPDPDLDACKGSPVSGCDIATAYRTAADYGSGAGPFKLRGTFAFVLLTNGQISVIDVDDLDAQCRVPEVFDAIQGCPPVGFQGDPSKEWLSSFEASCRVVVPHAPRSSFYVTTNDAVGRHRPGLGDFPSLADQTGAVLEPPDTGAASASHESPLMRAPVFEDGSVPVVSVAGTLVSPNAEGTISPNSRHMAILNLETPRAHPTTQNWVIAYEGPLPSLGNSPASITFDGEADGIQDPGARYCDRGVLSFAAWKETLLAEGLSEDQAVSQALDLADRLQLTGAFPAEDGEDANPDRVNYWNTNGNHVDSEPFDGVCDEGTEQTSTARCCSFDQCEIALGNSDAPLPSREMVILEAYQDRLVVDAPAVAPDIIKCCLPGLANYVVRPHAQWVVVGDANGFLHHVIPDPATGACRNNCDPNEARMNGRARRAPPGKVLYGAKEMFQNPMLNFAITDGYRACSTGADCPGTPCNDQQCVIPPQRDMRFRFLTEAPFSPLVVNVLGDSTNVAPVGLVSLPPFGELVVSDGGVQGLVTVSLANVATSRQIF